jgi:hypothetical protein
LSWGWRLVSKQRFYGWWIKITALLVSLVSVSTLLAFSRGWDGWPVATGLGGSIGYIVNSLLSGLVTGWGTAPLMLLVSVGALPLAFGLRRREWLALAVLVGVVGSWAWHVVQLVRDALRGVVSDDRVYIDDEEEDEEVEEERPARRARVRERVQEMPKLQLKKIPARAIVETRKRTRKRRRARSTSKNMRANMSCLP